MVISHSCWRRPRWIGVDTAVTVPDGDGAQEIGVVVDPDDVAAAVLAEPDLPRHAGQALDDRAVHAAVHDAPRLQQLVGDLKAGRCRRRGSARGIRGRSRRVEPGTEAGRDVCASRRFVYTVMPETPASRCPEMRTGPAHCAGPVLRVDRESLQPSGLRCGPVVQVRVCQEHRQGCPNLASPSPCRRVRAVPRTGRPNPTSASSTAWPRRMLVSSLEPASRGTCVAALTTAAPTMCHIAAIEIARTADLGELGEQRLESAMAAVCDPRRQRRLVGQGDDPVPGRLLDPPPGDRRRTGRRAVPAASDRRPRPSRSRPRSPRAPTGSPGRYPRPGPRARSAARRVR